MVSFKMQCYLWRRNTDINKNLYQSPSFKRRKKTAVDWDQLKRHKGVARKNVVSLFFFLKISNLNK